ncbi:hypothetical protein NMY22_g3775 [Coprinellus aureogranulatus]|nr:hypothetical protein NMY22_g3775 [Coprinellus aureogranulatus]
MPPNTRGMKPARTPPKIDFYDYGAGPSSSYTTRTSLRPDRQCIDGLTVPCIARRLLGVGHPCWCASAYVLGFTDLQAQRSQDGTPQTSSGPARTYYRRASHRFEEKILSNSSKAPKPPHSGTSVGHGQQVRLLRLGYAQDRVIDNDRVPQQVRFDIVSPEMNRPMRDPEYGLAGGVDLDIWRAFMAADTDRSGLIDPYELRTALVNSPWNKRLSSCPPSVARPEQFHPAFDKETIDMLIDIFDLNRNKAIEFHEAWRAEFEKADRDGSGTIDARELKKALARFGYNLPLRIITQLHRKHASHSGTHNAEGGITFDQFIRACVSVADFGKTFEQFNGPRNEQNKAKFEAFVLAAFSGT